MCKKNYFPEACTFFLFIFSFFLKFPLVCLESKAWTVARHDFQLWLPLCGLMGISRLVWARYYYRQDLWGFHVCGRNLMNQLNQWYVIDVLMCKYVLLNKKKLAPLKVKLRTLGSQVKRLCFITFNLLSFPSRFSSF